MDGEKEKAYVALSGGGEAESLVEKIEERLSEFFEVDHYKKRIAEGRRYSIPKLYEEIGSAPTVIVIVDKKYLTSSEHCQEEIKFIMNNGIINKRVYPIITQDCPDIFDVPTNSKLKKRAKAFVKCFIRKKLKNEDQRKIEEFEQCKYSSEDFIERLRKENWVSSTVEELLNKIKKNKSEYIEKNGIESQLKPLYFKHKQDDYKEIIGRTWIIGKLKKLIDENSNKSIFWLTADAGYGKSAIATFLHREQENIGGIHYVEYGQAESKKTIRFLHTMISQLREKYEWYRRVIPDHIDEKGDADEIFNLFIYDPFTREESESCWYIIDGIDEAQNGDEKSITEFIGNKKLPNNFKLIVLGRGEERLMQFLNNSIVIDLEEETDANKEDCSTLIAKEFEEFSEEEFEKEAIQEKLLEKSEMNMLYLEKFFEAVHDPKEQDIDITKPESFPVGLPGIYFNYFKRITDSEDVYIEKYCPLLELMVTYNEPVPRLLAQDILDIRKRDLENLLNDFGTLIKEIDNRVFLYHRSLYEWLLNIVDDRDNQYRIDLDSGKKKFQNFLSELNSDYKEEYIGFFHLNRKLIDYYSTHKTKDLSTFFDMIESIEHEKKIPELNGLVDHYIVNNDITIAKELIDKVSKEVEVLSNIENLEEFQIYIETILRQIRVYDKLNLWSFPVKERTFKLLKENNNYNKSDKLTKYYIDILIAISYEYDSQEDRKKTLEIKHEAYDIIKQKYEESAHKEKWYLSYSKVLRSLAFTYENSEENKIKSLEQAYTYKKESYDLIQRHKVNSYEWKKTFIGICNDLSVNYQKKAYAQDLKEENINKALEYSEIAYADVKNYYEKEKMIWLELFLKTSSTKANTLFIRARIVKKNEDRETALQMQKDSLDLASKYYKDMGDRWLLEYAKSLSNMAFVYSDYIPNEENFIHYSDLSNSSHGALYKANPNKYVADCISHFGQMRGKYFKFDLNDKVLGAENIIEKILDKEINRGSDVWATAYFRYLTLNFKSGGGKEIHKRKKTRAYTSLCELNFDKWFNMKKIKFISEEKKVLFLIKWIKEEQPVEDYIFMLSGFLKNIDILENDEQKKEILNIALGKYREIKLYFKDKNDLKLYITYLNNLSKAYLDVKPEPFDLEEIHGLITMAKEKLNNSVCQTADWNEYHRICNENFKRAEEPLEETKKGAVSQKLSNDLADEQDDSVGQFYKGIIKRIMHFGIFVELPSGKDALLHISKISDERIDNLKERYIEGEEIEVVMIGRNEKGILLATKEYYAS